VRFVVFQLRKLLRSKISLAYIVGKVAQHLQTSVDECDEAEIVDRDPDVELLDHCPSLRRYGGMDGQ
jgi:hypothetical protein